MTEFKQFKLTDSGKVVTYPAHFADHPVLGQNLEPYDNECEVDKVVTAGHELPVEQRVSRVAKADKPNKTDSNKKEEKN